MTNTQYWWENYVRLLGTGFLNIPQKDKLFEPLVNFDVQLAMSLLCQKKKPETFDFLDHWDKLEDLCSESLEAFFNQMTPHFEGPVPLTSDQEKKVKEVLPFISSYPQSIIAGGWVRDLMLGVTPNDIDIWSLMKDWKKQTIPFGKSKEGYKFSFDSDEHLDISSDKKYPDFIHGIKTYDLGERKPQFICVDNPIGYVRTFDFSINMLILNHRGEVFSLHPQALSDLKTKTLRSNPLVLNSYTSTLSGREQRFLLEGFVFSFPKKHHPFP